jgi:hypothetical protein
MKIEKTLRAVIFTSLFILSFMLSGCGLPFSVEVPDEFAVYKKNNNFFIYSPDNLEIKIKTEKNNPVKNFDFWADVLKNHLIKNGYFLIDEEKIDANVKFLSSKSAPENSGKLEWRKFVWLMPLEHSYYKYMTAVAVKGKRIFIVEACAKKDIFDNYNTELEKIISSVSVK